MAFGNVIVPDVSFYQDDPTTVPQINFIKMKNAGASGVIIRAGQNTWIDSDFRYNWQNAEAAGLLRGAYWFYDSRNHPSNQAALFLSVVGSTPPELGYWLDLEEQYGAQYRGWQNWKVCLSALRQAQPMVGIYTAPYYWKTYRPIDPGELTFFGSFPLWIAHYGVLGPDIPAPWTIDRTWFWQFTSKGEGLPYGVESKEIDLNRFNGTIEEFRSRFGGAAVPPPQGGTMIVGKVITAAINIRLGAGGEQTGVYLRLNDQIEASENQFQWLHLTKINGVPVPNNNWWSSAGSSQQYIQWSVVDVPPPPPPEPVPVVKVPFTFKVDGYKQFSGELEAE